MRNVQYATSHAYERGERNENKNVTYAIIFNLFMHTHSYLKKFCICIKYTWNFFANDAIADKHVIIKVQLCEMVEWFFQMSNKCHHQSGHLTKWTQWNEITMADT